VTPILILLSAAEITLDTLPWQTLTAAGGGWALFGIAGWGVLSGRLIPRATHNDVVHDRDNWRAESRIKDAQIAEKDTQLRHLSEVGETQKAVLTAVARLGGGQEWRQ